MHGNTKHGEAVNGKMSPEYGAWSRMLDRCYNTNANKYKDYGGRGIIVCARWRNNVVNFIADMGRRPSSKHSLDRINNDGNYDPLNCRWATLSEQAINRRQSIIKAERLKELLIKEKELALYKLKYGELDD